MERLVVRVQLVVLCRVALARMVLVVAVIWQMGGCYCVVFAKKQRRICRSG
jgi:hypothetical protein